MCELASLPWNTAPKTSQQLLDIAAAILTTRSEAYDMVQAAATHVLDAGLDWTEQNLTLSLLHKEEDVRECKAFVGTIHAAKGLEWDNVFIVSCEEGTFPGARANPEEEARLFYVAATRAKNSLRISWCKTRPQNRGPKLPAGPAVDRNPSPFILCLATIESH